MHFLHKILRFISPLCGLSTNPNQGPSSWSLSSSMINFVVALHQGWDKRPLHILMDTIILEGILSYGPSKFIQGYGTLCHYSHIIVVWSCMEDVVLHYVLRRLFLENVICKLAFIWGKSKCTNTNGFISRDVSFLLEEKEVYFRHHKNLIWFQGGQYLVCQWST